ncbi:UNVERIFIED_CONTAM: hypothetical protein GTU68_014829 [Idotea baltica]|nr:hypothetical protein [Idotea baltica]
MVGGGRDAFIGGVHRIASRIDDHFELIAGAFSSTVEKSKLSGLDLGVAEDRSYGSFKEMAIREARLKDGIEAVSIVTPNHLHFSVAKEFLKRGIHVICDKPLTASASEAKKFLNVVESSNALFVLTHNYTAYPMIRQARAMIENKELGDIRVVQVEYAQDWLSTNLEDSNHKQASWRVDPERSGAGGCIGDIGTHAFNLAGFVTGLKLESLSADLHTFVEGRQLDDNVHIMMRYEGGAKGMLWSSQVAQGCENGLRLRVYGSDGAIEWYQEEPNKLFHAAQGEAKRIITRGGPGANDAANAVSRIPAGLPEGYLEGFATLYNETAHAIYAARDNKSIDTLTPGIKDGYEGIAFITAAVASSKKNGNWVKLSR